MTNEQKQLLLKDISARIPYGIRYKGDRGWGINPHQHTTSFCTILTSEKPLVYLRPMSSMTEDEREEFIIVGGVMSYSSQHDSWAISAFTPEAYDWINSHYFDYRGLIKRGLALEAPKDMYKIN